MTTRLELAVRNTDRVVPLSAGTTVTLGRTSQTDVQIDHPSVSRRHCEISVAEGILHVRDLGSVNGTFVNERAIQEAEARAGDEIRLGGAILDVRDPDYIPSEDDRAAVTVGESTVESVIQRRIDPSQVDWLTPSPEGVTAPEAALLRHMQRHLSTLHRISEDLAGARDINGITDATLHTILRVLPADRSAVLLRGEGADS